MRWVCGPTTRVKLPIDLSIINLAFTTFCHSQASEQSMASFYVAGIRGHITQTCVGCGAHCREWTQALLCGSCRCHRRGITVGGWQLQTRQMTRNWKEVMVQGHDPTVRQLINRVLPDLMPTRSFEVSAHCLDCDMKSYAVLRAQP